MLTTRPYFIRESPLRSGKETFGSLNKCLIFLVNNKIQNGEVTERALARAVSISQPQIHNVLKGSRKLQPYLADRLMDLFGISIEDLIERSNMMG